MVKCESLRINMFRITHTGKVSKFSRNNASNSFLDLKKYTEEINLCALKKKKGFRYHKWCNWSTASRYLEAYFIAVWNDHDRKLCWMLTMRRHGGKLSKN